MLVNLTSVASTLTSVASTLTSDLVNVTFCIVVFCTIKLTCLPSQFDWLFFFFSVNRRCMLYQSTYFLVESLTCLTCYSGVQN